MPPPQYQVLIPQAAQEEFREVIRRASTRGQATEALWASAKLLEGLRWLADELGESRFPLRMLGDLRVAVIGPVGVVFAVDRAKMVVHVGRFRLLGVRRG